MAEETYRGQSYKWPAYRIVCESEEKLPSHFENVRLRKTTAGNLTKLEVLPGGEWHGRAVHRSGRLTESKQSKSDLLLAIASSGSWSGGGNYSGYIFGKPGAVAWFTCKGSQSWLVFTQNGCAWQDTAPGTLAQEI